MCCSFLLFISASIISATTFAQNKSDFTERFVSKSNVIKADKLYEKYSKVSGKSLSKGSVSDGSLVNGKPFPYSGKNFTYFDIDSYLGQRAFCNEKVRTIILNTYKRLEDEVPNRHFHLMELSNRLGGKLFPHRTHQNGLSADFMMPKLKNEKPNYELDTLGKDHYWLAFDNDGKYGSDQSIEIDFNLIAHHIILLDEEARKVGMKIKKVIIKIEYKDDLFATDYGKKLKSSDIYIVQGLNKMINALHDDHFHIDFTIL